MYLFTSVERSISGSKDQKSLREMDNKTIVSSSCCYLWHYRNTSRPQSLHQWRLGSCIYQELQRDE